MVEICLFVKDDSKTLLSFGTASRLVESFMHWEIVCKEFLDYVKTFNTMQVFVSRHVEKEFMFSPPTPQYNPASPQYNPVSPQYRPSSPQYNPVSPQYRPSSPQYNPASPQYRPSSLQYIPASPKYEPSVFITLSGNGDHYIVNWNSLKLPIVFIKSLKKLHLTYREILNMIQEINQEVINHTGKYLIRKVFLDTGVIKKEGLEVIESKMFKTKEDFEVKRLEHVVTETFNKFEDSNNYFLSQWE